MADDGLGLPDALREHERRLLAERPERVVLADDSDTALAAALVAAKLGVALATEPSANAGTSTNARLIAQLVAAP